MGCGIVCPTDLVADSLLWSPIPEKRKKGMCHKLENEGRRKGRKDSNGKQFWGTSGKKYRETDTGTFNPKKTFILCQLRFFILSHLQISETCPWSELTSKSTRTGDWDDAIGDTLKYYNAKNVNFMINFMFYVNTHAILLISFSLLTVTWKLESLWSQEQPKFTHPSRAPFFLLLITTGYWIWHNRWRVSLLMRFIVTVRTKIPSDHIPLRTLLMPSITEA